MEEELINKKEIKKNKNILIVSILSTIIILLGSAYAFFTYFKSAEAFTLTSNSITASFTEGTNQIDFTNAYPISDEFALENLSKLDYIDFTVSGNAINSKEAITYEIFLTEANGNTLDKNYIKTYVTDENGGKVTDPTKYGSLPQTTYGNEPTGKVVLKKTYKGEFTKSYRLYIWLDSTYEQNEVSQTFSFYVNIYAYNDKSDNAENTLSKKIEQLATTESYIKNYTTDFINNSSYTYNNSSFDTQDTYLDRTRAEKKDVYYFTGDDALTHGNVLFGGFCWQIIRTTDTGGIKLIYNGVAENDKCKTDRTAGKGVNAKESYVSSQSTNVSSLTNFGTGYDYDLNAGTFTLTGTETLTGKTWANNSSNLIGTYACSDNSTTCTELWYIGHYYSSTNASVAKYVIGDVAHYSQTGTSYYNAYYDSPALVGYMYNKAYRYNSGAKTNSYYANSVKYENGSYVLQDVQSEVASAPGVGYKYVCDDTDSTTCNKVRFYYYNNYYVLLENGDTNPIYAMLNGKTQGETADANINIYNSAIKGYLDNWYKKNIVGTSAEGKIDTSAVYCNDRSSSNTFGSWNKDATATNTDLYFKQYSANKDLRCENKTDRFTAENINTSAKLEYPVGLLTEPERRLMTVTNSNYAKTGQWYWALSPYRFYYVYAYVRFVYTSGESSYYIVYYAGATRPVVSLRPDAEISGGEGTYESPYLVN